MEQQITEINARSRHAHFSHTKIAAIIVLLGCVPAIAFYIGVKFQETKIVLQEESLTAAQYITFVKPDIEIVSTAATSSIEYELKAFYRNGKKFMMPYLTTYEDVLVMDKVNKYLSTIEEGFGCGPEGTTKYFESKTEVINATNDIYSVSIFVSYDCGGAHPTNDSDLSLTFDMKTGEVVPFENLFSNFKADKEKIVGVIFENQIKGAVGAPQDDTSCRSMHSITKFAESYYSYVIDGDYISVRPIWGHAIQACATASVIPITRLASFFDETSILSRAK